MSWRWRGDLREREREDEDGDDERGERKKKEDEPKSITLFTFLPPAALLSQLSKPAPLFNCPRRHRSSVFHALRSSENLLISTSKCLRIHGLMDFFLLGLLTTNSHNANDNECPVREKNNQLQPFFNPETSSKPSIFHSNTDRSQPSEEMFHSERASMHLRYHDQDQCKPRLFPN
ncbi:hypothetical protein Q3G72_031352 [Acer saccharum]|nr:hypothetical protein Q3G72_031352 [Acer saccharum]